MNKKSDLLNIWTKNLKKEKHRKKHLTKLVFFKKIYKMVPQHTQETSVTSPSPILTGNINNNNNNFGNRSSSTISSSLLTSSSSSTAAIINNIMARSPATGEIIFGSQLVDSNSRTPYSDATQVRI